MKEPTPNMKAPLAPLAGAVPPRPAWFEAALARAPERSVVEVLGTGIEVLTWGERGRPTTPASITAGWAYSASSTSVQ